MPAQVLISEVGPRDGLQSVKATMPTQHKLAWIDALHGAGLRESEGGSFVPPRLLPQMCDVWDVIRPGLKKPRPPPSAGVTSLKSSSSSRPSPW